MQCVGLWTLEGLAFGFSSSGGVSLAMVLVGLLARRSLVSQTNGCGRTGYRPPSPLRSVDVNSVLDGTTEYVQYVPVVRP